MINFIFLLPRKSIVVLLLVMVTGMVFLGLYPFNYFSPNRVSWLESGSGIRFNGSGQALSKEISDWPWESYSGEPFTLELSLIPSRTYTRGIPHILSLCDSSGREVAYFGQWKDFLIIRLMETSYGIERIKKEIGTGSLLTPGKSIFLTLVFRDGVVELYANGHPVKSYTDFDLISFMKSRPVRSIVFGNSAAADSPWRGDLLGFSVLNRKLDQGIILDRYSQWLRNGKSILTGKSNEMILYQFNELSGKTVQNMAAESWHLLIPEILDPLRREFLSLPSVQFVQKRSFFLDAFINTAGFVPLGFVLILFWGVEKNLKNTHAVSLAVVSGALLSLFIEINQAFLVSRDSSITDLILNTLGTALGVGVYWIVRKGLTPSY